MSAIAQQFEQAQLAEASYAIFDSSVYGNQTNLAIRLNIANSSQFKGGFSTAQATAFVTQYRVMDQYTAPPLVFGIGGTGFSATLFQNIETGRYTFAVRGTELGLADLVNADFQGIVINGVAMDQLVGMYNYWKSLNSSGVFYQAAKLETMAAETAQLSVLNAARLIGGAAAIIAYDSYVALLKSSGAILETRLLSPTTVRRIVTGNSDVLLAGASLALGSGKLASTVPLDVVGHSLGGHLAAAFTRLFPLVPANAITVNGAGFPTGLTPGLGGNAESNIQNLFSQLNGAPSFDASRISNLHGSGPNFVTQNSQFGLVQQGTAQEIFIERNDAGVVFGHAAGQMTDTLAMYDLFASLDFQLKSANLTTVNTALHDIFRAASARAVSSHERLLDGLIKLVGLSYPALGDSNSSANEREELFKRIVVLRPAVSGLIQSNPNLSLIPIPTISAANLIEGATGAQDATPDVTLAYRYALRELNPFIITGSEALYAPHNTGANAGNLDLYNATATVRTGALTSEWIADRAAFLAWKNIANTADVTALASPQTTAMQRFIDLPQQINLSVIPQGPGLPSVPQDELTRRFIFGGDGIEVLTGGDKSDRLYGSGGIDYLAGKKEIDYLEGGAGRDVYEYNGYALTLLSASTNDGADLIRDTDGRGVLRYLWNDNPAPTSTAIADASVKVSATEWTSADGRFRYVKSTNAENGTDLTITILADAEGTMVLKDFRDGDFGIKLGTRGAHPGPATISGGGGRNTLEGGVGNDLIEGGADGTAPDIGGDFIYGDLRNDPAYGNDDIYGNVKTTLQEALTPVGDAAIPTGLRGDWLNGRRVIGMEMHK